MAALRSVNPLGKSRQSIAPRFPLPSPQPKDLKPQPLTRNRKPLNHQLIHPSPKVKTRPPHPTKMHSPNYLWHTRKTSARLQPYPTRAIGSSPFQPWSVGSVASFNSTHTLMNTHHAQPTPHPPAITICLLWICYTSQAGVAPAINNTGHPVSQWAPAGATVEFVVSATGDQPLKYQWQHDGSPIARQTNAFLALFNVQPPDAGAYDVVVKNNYGSVLSRPAQLNVDPLFRQILQGPHVEDMGASGYGGCGDMDGDGFFDLSVNRYAFGAPAVYHNNGDGTFALVPNPLPLTSENQWLGFWGDWDCDGNSDLMFGSDLTTDIAFGTAQGTFNVRPLSGMGGNWWGCASADFDRDGFVDLYTTLPNALYRNLGNRSFVKVDSSQVGPLAGLNTWGGACWGDLNNDGWPDLYIPSMEQNRSYMYLNNGHGSFVGLANTVTLQASPAINGAWGDFDNDGLLDLYVAAFNGTSRLYRNLGNTDFEPVDGATTLFGTHNHAAWIDYDNDGFLDLYVSGYQSGNKLFRNNGNGTLSKARSSMINHILPPSDAGTYTGIWFDDENDGFLDLYLLNGDDYASIQTANQFFHNQGNDNAWIAVNLEGTVSNRRGIGAQVRILATYAGQPRWQRRDISGGDLNNGNQLRAHFGLSNATSIHTLRIEWPSGTIQELHDIKTKQLLTITEPPRVVAHGTGSLHITSWPNQSFELQTSTDLMNWTPLSTVTNLSGAASFQHAPSSQQPSQFYRTGTD